MGAVLGFHCETTNGYEHSLFYPYDSFFLINILFYAQSAFCYRVDKNKPVTKNLYWFKNN